MGQPSIPSLNKTGESMYWNSMWDDKINYGISLNECLFLKEVVPNFFQNFSEHRVISYMYKKDFFSNEKRLKDHYNVTITKKYLYKELTSKFSKNYIKMFFSHVWVIKFQNWVFLYFFVYHPSLKNISKYRQKKIFKKNLLNNIVSNYINSLIYLKFFNQKKNNFHSKKYNF